VETNENDKILAKKACITCGLEFEPGFTICPDDGTPLTSLTDDALIGTVMADRYEILEVIGGGGMGLVYKARHKLMNRIVAIKMLHKHMISSADTLKRFQLEAQAASCLNLPNILTVYDFGLTNDGQPYMVMDYLEGISLADVIEEEDHIAVDRAVNIFIQACTGLAHAHQKGVLHRDIKPSNIMLVNFDDKPDFVKIVDFGIAKLLNQGNTGELTKTGEVYGSPSYMSPEQCRGKETDARSDIYALGCVMYRSLSGCPLFSGDDIIELLFKQVSEQPATFDVLCPEFEIPTELEDIVFKALAKSAVDRYQTMDQFKEALEYFRDKRNLKPTDSPRPLWKRPETAPSARASAAAAPAAAQASSAAAANTMSSEPAPARRTASEPAARREEATQRPRPAESPSQAPSAVGAAERAASSNRTTANSAVRNTSPGESMRRSADTNDGTGRSALRRKMQPDNKALIIAIGAVALVAICAVAFVWHASTSSQGPLTVTEEPEHPTDTTTDTATAGAESGDPITDGKQALESKDYAKAKTQFQNALSANQKKYGKDSAEVGEALSLLSSAMIGLNDFKGAETNAKDALTIKEAKSGANSQDLVGDLVVLATAYRHEKQFAPAEEMLKRAISIQEKIAGKNDLTAGNFDFQLAQVYREEGKSEDADALAKKALDIKETSLGSDNPQITQIKTFLAGAPPPAHTAPVQPTQTTEPPAVVHTPPTPPAQQTTVHTASKPEHTAAKPVEHHHHAAHHEAPHHEAAVAHQPTPPAPDPTKPHHRHAYSSYQE